MNTTGNSSPLAACSVISVTRSSVVLPGVGVVHQADVLQELLEVAFARIVLVELAGGGEQFLDVRQPLLVLLVLGVLQHLR